MAAGAAMLQAGGMAGPALQFERGLSTSKISPRFELQGLHLAPATFNRTPLTHRMASKKLLIRAQANSRDASSPGSTPPGEIKKTVEREVGVSAGKSSPVSPGNHSPVSSSHEHAKVSDVSEAVQGTMSYAAAAENLRHVGSKVVSEQMAQNQAKKVKEVSEAVKGTMSYAAVAENLRHEGPKPGPIRSEVLERAESKQQDRLEERAQERAKTDERPFKEPRQDETLNLKTQSGRRFSFKSLAVIVAILFIAFGFAPVWSPIVGKVLTPFFQLVGVAVAVKFFVTDFLRADKRKELYKKGEQFKEDVTGS